MRNRLFPALLSVALVAPIAAMAATPPAGAVTTNAVVDDQHGRLGPQFVAHDRRRQRRRSARHRHRARGRPVARDQRGERPRPPGLAAADGNRDRQHPRGRRSQQQWTSPRSSSVWVRRWCRTNRAASRSTTPTEVCTARTAPRTTSTCGRTTVIPTAMPTASTRRPAIGDINGDGYPDIVFGGFDLHIHTIDRNCNSILSDNIEDTVGRHQRCTTSTVTVASTS